MKPAIQALFVALAIVVRAGAAGAPAQETVKVGVIQPLSGPVAASGNYVRMGAEIGARLDQRQGRRARPQGRALIEDNKSDPKEAATAAEKLIVRDKVPVIVGAWGSSMTLAAMPKLEEYGVPMVVETSSAATITKRGNPWVFRISPPSEMEALGLEKYLKDLGDQAGGLPRRQHRLGPRRGRAAFGDLLKERGATVGRGRVHGAGRHRHERADHQGEGGRRRHALPHHQRRADHAGAEAGAGAAARRARSSPPAAARRPSQLIKQAGRRPRARSTSCSSCPGSPRRCRTASWPRPSWTSGPSAAIPSRG